jgi:hypothetical protein
MTPKSLPYFALNFILFKLRKQAGKGYEIGHKFNLQK